MTGQTTAASGSRSAPRLAGIRARTLVLLAALVVAVVAVAVAVAGRSGDGTAKDGVPQTGSAIEGVGLVTGGTLGFSTDAIRLGHSYGFAFPQLHNRTGTPVRLIGFTMSHVPSGVAVTGYRVLSIKQSGYPMVSYLGNGAKDDYLRYPDHASAKPTIAAHKTSAYFPVVIVKISRRVPDLLTGCTVRYEQAGQQYEQVLPCRFGFGG